MGVVMQLAQSRVGKTLDKPDHFAADGGIFFHHGHFEILIRQVQCRLQTGDSAADAPWHRIP